MHTAIVTAPLTTPALIPLGLSSKTRHFSIGKPSSLAARRNGSGKGLPRLRRGSSAVMVIFGRWIPARRSAPWQSVRNEGKKRNQRKGGTNEQVLAPEVATAKRSFGSESIKRRTPGRMRTLLFWQLCGDPR